MRRIDWYFDFISPFAYFALPQLARLPADVEVQYRPVLLAGLLKHWDNKGPAEIAPKRLWTYRSCTWWAQRHGLPFQFPAAHPFNPLAYLRLAIAAGSKPDAIQTIFNALWTTGADASDPALPAALAAQLGLAPTAIDSPEVKNTLRTNTEAAAAAGVFGVPSLVIDGEVFWGADGMDFARDFLADPALLQSPAMRRLAELPEGVRRS